MGCNEEKKVLFCCHEVICMTINDLKNSTAIFVKPADIAPILGCDAQSIRRQAKQDASQLGFPVICLGSRIRIPRTRFLEYLGVQDTKSEEDGPK